MTVEAIPAVIYDRIGFSLRAIIDYQIHSVIVTEGGRLDEGRLSRAVALCMKAEPAVNRYFVPHAIKPYWRKAESIDYEDCFKVIISDDSAQSIDDFIAEPFDPFKAPQIKARLVRNHIDTLVIKVNHMISDAAGVREFSYNIAETYRRLKAYPAYKPKQKDYKTRGIANFLKGLSVKDWMRVIRRGFRDLSSKKLYWIANSESNGSVEPFIKHELLDLRPLRLFAKSNNATINDLLIATYFRSLLNVLEPSRPDKISMTSTVDLRRNLSDGSIDAMRSFSGFMYPCIRTSPDDNLTATLKKVTADMNFRKSDCPGLGDISGLGLIGALPFSIGAGIMKKILKLQFMGNRFRPAITNIGIIDPDKLFFEDDDVVNAYITPSMSHLGVRSFPLSASSYKDNLNLFAGVFGDRGERETVDNVVGVMCRELRAIGTVKQNEI